MREKIFIMVITALILAIPSTAQIPQLINVYVQKETNTKAVMVFNFDIPANYSMRYGTDYNLYSEKNNREVKFTEKRIILDGLYPDLTYYYNITACDYYNDCMTYGPYMFKISTKKYESYANTEEKIWNTMYPGSNFMYLHNPEMNIQSIDFRLEKELFNTKVTLKKLDRRPQGRKYLKTKVYRYFQTDMFHITDDDIINAEIKFMVDKDWLLLNGLQQDNIFLYKYETDWVPVPTYITSQDSTNVYYRANTDNVNTFAIAEFDPAEATIDDYQPIKVKISLKDETTKNFTGTNITGTISSTEIKTNETTIENESTNTTNLTIEQPATLSDKKFDIKKVASRTSMILIVIILGGILALIIITMKGEYSHYKALNIFEEKSEIKKIIRNMNRNMKRKQIDVVRKQYDDLVKEYNKLTREDKNRHYPKIEKIIERLKSYPK